MRTYRQFSSAEEARKFRYENGTGGWIFASDPPGLVILFPPDMPPSEIFTHRFTKGLNGELYGCQ